MKKGSRILALVSLTSLQAPITQLNVALAQTQTVVVTGSTCPVNAKCYSGYEGYYGGGTSGGSQSYIPENETQTNAAGTTTIIGQAEAIAKGVKMVCPLPGEPYQPGYYERAMAVCTKDTADALGTLGSAAVRTAAAYTAGGLQASRIRLAWAGLDSCK